MNLFKWKKKEPEPQPQTDDSPDFSKIEELINDERANYLAAMFALTELSKILQQSQEMYRLNTAALLLRLGDQCEVSSNIMELAADPNVTVDIEEKEDGSRVYRLEYKEDAQ